MIANLIDGRKCTHDNVRTLCTLGHMRRFIMHGLHWFIETAFLTHIGLVKVFNARGAQKLLSGIKSIEKSLSILGQGADYHLLRVHLCQLADCHFYFKMLLYTPAQFIEWLRIHDRDRTTDNFKEMIQVIGGMLITSQEDLAEFNKLMVAIAASCK